jgi:hypothetical protein
VSIISMSQEVPQNTPARRLTSEEEKAMALDVLSGKSITETAQKHCVSRNSNYAQKHEAETAIHHAFSDNDDGDVLFYLPVSKRLIAQMVLGMVLICKAFIET